MNLKIIFALFNFFSPQIMQRKAEKKLYVFKNHIKYREKKSGADQRTYVNMRQKKEPLLK